MTLNIYSYNNEVDTFIYNAAKLLRSVTFQKDFLRSTPFRFFKTLYHRQKKSLYV